MTDEEQTPNIHKYLGKIKEILQDPQKKNLLILALIGIAAIYLVFSIFSHDSNAPKQEDAVAESAPKPVQVKAADDLPTIPDLPNPPQLSDPTPPQVTEIANLPKIQLPEQAPEANAIPNTILDTPVMPNMPPDMKGNNYGQANNNSFAVPVSEEAQDAAGKRKDQKQKAAIMLIAGQPPAGKTAEILEQEATFVKRGDMNLVLGRGKILDAVIETAVDSDFGGEVRAIITRDIYSEWGKNILIPKGSKVFGEYNVGIEGMYGRISINWVRIDLTNGYTMNLGSAPSVDNLGRGGVQGRVDNKFFERFSNAVFNSVLNVRLAKLVDSLVKPAETSQAANDKNLIASTMQQTTTNIAMQSNLTDLQKRLQICSSVLASIKDITSPTYTNIQNSCNKFATDPTADDTAKLNALVNIITAEANNLIQNTSTAVTPNKAQESAQQGYQDVAEVIKSISQGQELKPTITVNQGTPIKIYVNKDFKFPKAVISKQQR
jgi:type IV secretion system protein VirB10